MTDRWADLFERASTYGVSTADLRGRLAAERDTAASGDATDHNGSDAEADQGDSAGGTDD